MSATTLKTAKKKPNSFDRKRNPRLRYCIHDRSERQVCAKCNAFNRLIEGVKDGRD